MTESETVEPTADDPADRHGLKPPWPEPRVLRVWAGVEMAAAAVLLVVIFVSVLWQVVSRYVPALSWPEIGEAGNYSLVLLAFVMLGYLVGRNGHITIQIIDYLVKGRAFVAVKVLSAASVAVICGLLANECYGLLVLYSERRTAALELPFWFLYAVPMAGLVSGAVRAVVNILTAHRQQPTFDPTGES
jgi:TRAP-type C4-dicarboxylate transport system permease small subunit